MAGGKHPMEKMEFGCELPDYSTHQRCRIDQLLDEIAEYRGFSIKTSDLDVAASWIESRVSPKEFSGHGNMLRYSGNGWDILEGFDDTCSVYFSGPIEEEILVEFALTWCYT